MMAANGMIIGETEKMRFRRSRGDPSHNGFKQNEFTDLVILSSSQLSVLAFFDSRIWLYLIFFTDIVGSRMFPVASVKGETEVTTSELF